MASIRQRGCKYLVRVSKAGVTANKTFKTKDEAEAFALETEAAILRGVFVADETVTVRALLERYQTEVTPRKKGHLEESGHIDNLMKTGSAAKHLLDLQLYKLTAPSIASWRDLRLQQVSPATLMREWSILQHCINTAAREWGYRVANNPFEAVRRPRIDNARSRRVTHEEIQAIITASESVQLANIITLAVETAMRRSELLSLRWQHIDLKRRIATLKTTKNGASRTSPLSSRAIAVLESLPRRLDGAEAFSLRPDSVTQAFARSVRRAREAYEAATPPAMRDPHHLTDLRWHDLRHEACSRLAELGLSTTELASISGHKTLQLVQRYTHHRAEELARKLG